MKINLIKRSNKKEGVTQMGKVFGYPEFDANGEKILTTYDNDYKDMLMDIRVYRMSQGQTKELLKPEEEMAVLLLKGKLKYSWNGQEKEVYRKDVFTDGLYALHVCKNAKVVIEAESDAEVLIQCTDNEREFEAKFYDPENTPWIYSCKDKFGGTAKRRVSTAFDYETAPYSNMVLGEVLNDPGNWSGYIPHTHPQPETYYFLFDRPEGFGASFVGDEVFKSVDGSFSAIPGGKVHPQSCAPGFQMYTCWMIRHLPGNPWTDRIDDERYTWLYDYKG